MRERGPHARRFRFGEGANNTENHVTTTMTSSPGQ
jgi:hypothetical protein